MRILHIQKYLNILLPQVLDDKLTFVKVHAPWEVLCTYAEIMHIKLPLQPNDLKTRESALSWIRSFFSADENIIKPEQEFFTAPFENDRLSDFYVQDKDTFFTPATRSRIVSLRDSFSPAWFLFRLGKWQSGTCINFVTFSAA